MDSLEGAGSHRSPLCGPACIFGITVPSNILSQGQSMNPSTTESVESKAPPAVRAEAEPTQGAPLIAAIRTAACALFAFVGWLLDGTSISLPLHILAYVAGGIGPAWATIAALRERQLNVDLLMLLAAAGAAYLGDWTEGAVLLFLFSLSGTLEAYAMYRTRHSIDALIQLRPR